MSTDHLDSGYQGDLLAHPLAGIIAKLDGTKEDGPGRHNLARDVRRLLSLARPEAPEPHEAAESVRRLREHLTEAERLARSLPDWITSEVDYAPPEGKNMGDLIARAGEKLRMAEGIAASLCEHYPADHKKRRNETRDRVAAACRVIFEERTGLEAKASKHAGKMPAGVFSNFVYDVFKVLKLKDTETSWHRPAQKAVTAKVALK